MVGSFLAKRRHVTCCCGEPAHAQDDHKWVLTYYSYSYSHTTAAHQQQEQEQVGVGVSTPRTLPVVLVLVWWLQLESQTDIPVCTWLDARESHSVEGDTERIPTRQQATPPTRLKLRQRTRKVTAGELQGRLHMEESHGFPRGKRSIIASLCFCFCFCLCLCVRHRLLGG